MQKKNTLIDNGLFWSEVKMNNYCLFKLALEEKHLRSMPQRALVLLFQGIENDISGQNRTEQNSKGENKGQVRTEQATAMTRLVCFGRRQ